MRPRRERKGYHRHDNPIEENVGEDGNADGGQNERFRRAQAEQSRGRGAVVDASSEEVFDAAHCRLPDPGQLRRGILGGREGAGKVSILEGAKHRAQQTCLPVSVVGDIGVMKGIGSAE